MNDKMTDETTDPKTDTTTDTNNPDYRPEVDLIDLGPRPPRYLRVDEHSYQIPDSVHRIDVARMIDMAERCGSEAMEATAAVTVRERATGALAFLARSLRVDTDEDLANVVADEIKRYPTARQAGIEIYANLYALENWVQMQYGKFSRLFLCDQHRDLAGAQMTIAESYAMEDSEDESVEHDTIASAIQEALQRTYDHERH